jgi:hypothetical protein
MLEAVQRISRITGAWISFGVLSLYLIIGIPIMLTIWTILLLLPFITLWFGWSNGILVAIYVTVVMIGTAIYCIHSFYNDDDDSNAPLAGAKIDSEARALARSRSRIRTSQNRNRRI